MFDDLKPTEMTDAQFNLAQRLLYFKDYGIKTAFTNKGARVYKGNKAIYFNITDKKTSSPKKTKKDDIYVMDINTKDSNKFELLKNYVYDIFSSNYKPSKSVQSKSYSNKDKLNYYHLRIKDKSLTKNQREFALKRYKTLKKKVGT